MTAHEGASRVASWMIGRRWWVVALWTAVLGALAGGASRVERLLDVGARVEGSESASVDATLRERFDSPFARYAVLVLTGVPAPHTDRGERILREALATVQRVRGVTGTVSWRDAHDSLFLSARGGGTFAIVGLDPGAASPDVMVERVRAATSALAARLRGAHPALALRWSGDVALNYDIRRASALEGQRAEGRALPLTLALLVVAFGSVVAAFLPVIAAVVAIVTALGITALLAVHWPLSILLANIVTMLGLGLGVDYALLIVSRFREELSHGRGRLDAAARAATVAGHTIMLSGSAVLIGFLALALVPLSELRAIAVGGALAVGCSVLVSVTLVPALLAVLGDRVNRGRVRRGASRGAPSERWRRWGGWVVAHPLLVLVLAGTPMLLLAAQARRIRTGLPRSGWLPSSMESARALEDLATMDRAGVAQALRLVVDLPPGASALEGAGWRAVARISRHLARLAHVERVQSLPRLVGADEASPLVRAMLPVRAVRTFVSRDQRSALVELLPRSDVDFPALTAFVRDVRRLDAGQVSGLRGTRLRVGGMPAFNADYEDAIAGATPRVVALVLAGTLLALAVGFRSILIPIKALLLNLLSVAAALGAVVLVFQDGHGAAVVGMPGAMGSLFPALPVLVFCIVFGLSMDYEVFLVARVAEARRAGATEGDAIADGLARTGGVITSAAAVMIVVFAAFMLGGFLVTKVLGFALAAAVCFDATVVRVALGPALLRLAGRWNWWPAAERSLRHVTDVAAPRVTELHRTRLPWTNVR